MKKVVRLMVFVIMVSCICINSIMPTFAAANKTSTKTYDVITVDNGFAVLNCYARDTFQITHDGKKVISCKATQTSKDLSSGMFVKGGIKLKKKKAAKWTYESVWSINMVLMPKAMMAVAKKYAPEVIAIQKIGTIVKATTTYEVTASGTLKKTKTNLKWFTTLAKYKKQIEKFFNW